MGQYARRDGEAMPTQGDESPLRHRFRARMRAFAVTHGWPAASPWHSRICAGEHFPGFPFSPF